MKKILSVTVLAVATAIAGCGSGRSMRKDATGAPQLQAVAASIGCTGLDRFSNPTLYVSAEGRCRYQGRTVDLATFASDKLRDNWLKIAVNFEPLIKDGPGWAAVQE